MSQVLQDCGTDKLQVSSLSASYELFVTETQLHVGLTWNKVYSIANQ